MPSTDAPPEAEQAPAVEAPSGTDLVVRDTTDRAEILAVLDRHDEALIVEELQRRSLQVMLYSFPLDGKDVTDLSYLGVNEAVRVMNNEHAQRITVDRGSLTVESVEEDLGSGPEPCFVATVYAVNERTGYGQWATATQPKRLKLKDASKARHARSKDRHVYEVAAGEKTLYYVADQFARQKAVNKAQRNALRVHIPEQVRQTMIAQFEGDAKRIKRIQVGAGAETLAELPPPLTDERAGELRDQARAVYDELREVNPILVTPASYHAYLARAEHSHDRLQEFIDYLGQRLDEAKGEAQKEAQ